MKHFINRLVVLAIAFVLMGVAVQAELAAQLSDSAALAPAPDASRLDDAVWASDADGEPAEMLASCVGAVGNCCTPHGGLGCNDLSCCNAVCLNDPVCCNSQWDGECAALAVTFCSDEQCYDGACPGDGGNCCTNNGTPGCDDTSCCEIVCSHDSFCCDFAWTTSCAGYAEALCGDLCSAPPICPGAGDCCSANGTPSCNNGCCCQAVCEQLPDCCTTGWTAACATLAETHCPGLCTDPAPGCPGEGDCTESHATTGCEDPLCCTLVCNHDDWCCTEQWDTVCADYAFYEFCDCPESPCPGGGGLCCSANGIPGCNDTDCCNVVCNAEPSCCEDTGGWDEACVTLAASLCEPQCTCQIVGDFDGNVEVDLTDFARLQNCFTGVTDAPLTEACFCGNTGGDDDVDAADYAHFHSVFTGP